MSTHSDVETNFFQLFDRQNAVLIIQVGSRDIPLLFLSLLREFFKKKYPGVLIKRFDTTECDDTMLFQELSMSFLGLGIWYWLESIAELDKERKHKWYTFLSSYQGPHRIICITDEMIPVSGDQTFVIKIPDNINYTLCEHILSLLPYKPSTGGKILLERLFKQHTQVPVEIISSIIRYVPLVSVSDAQDDFLLHSLLLPEYSLFTLSTHFFAKQASLFFTYWTQIVDRYSTTFWHAYWSEQLWRAAHVVACAQAHGVHEAKKISQRLPFSLLKKDWKHLLPSELMHAHNILYQSDYAYKQGNNAPLLEAMFVTFFEGGFR